MLIIVPWSIRCTVINNLQTAGNSHLFFSLLALSIPGNNLNASFASVHQKCIHITATYAPGGQQLGQQRVDKQQYYLKNSFKPHKQMIRASIERHAFRHKSPAERPPKVRQHQTKSYK
jgi:hypothetical protein